MLGTVGGTGGTMGGPGGSGRYGWYSNGGLGTAGGTVKLQSKPLYLGGGERVLRDGVALRTEPVVALPTIMHRCPPAIALPADVAAPASTRVRLERVAGPALHRARVSHPLFF